MLATRLMARKGVQMSVCKVEGFPLCTVVNALHCISWDGRMEHLLFYLPKQSPVLALYNNSSLSTSNARRGDVVQHLRSTPDDFFSILTESVRIPKII
jgi:hypothetical protein